MDVADLQTGLRKHRDDVGYQCQKMFQDFLEEFEEDNKNKYLYPCNELTKMERNSLEVSFEDVEKHNQHLATAIIEDYYRVYPYLCQAVENVVKDHHAMSMSEKKEFYVSFVDVPTRHKVRELKSTKVGTLLRISGQVVRTHPVHPELTSGTFTCLDCRTVIPNVEQQFKFTFPAICRNPVCNNRKRFNLEVDKSVFVDFQKVKVQEAQSELPRGSIPRSIDVILHAEAVETVQAGDRYDFTGTLVVVPDVGALSSPGGTKSELAGRRKGGENVTDGVRGLKALGVRDLNYRMAFLACSVTPSNPRFFAGEFQDTHLTAELIKKQMTNAEWNKVYEMSKDRNLYKNLIDSLFPSIYGNEQVKKGIILMLFGGVPKKTIEGTTLRGDLNCCIVGDPSTAKSQFLKQVAELCPRSVYTSGKASTAAGLTAAVVKDEESFDFVIEAGALLLADNGICCIDEFDKMELHDQVAIHEAMEQQTISIAKAGVRATLNARTSILAAANPINGRYDRTKSLQQNVSLSAPIMSRFDLFFVLVDECNEVVDYAIARKIISLHSNLEEIVDKAYTQDEVLRYIIFAKQFKPTLSEEAKELLVEAYTQLRQRDSQGNSKGVWKITVRQLESLIRLSEAMAKMECKDEVARRHVAEAFHLLNKSIIRVEQPDITVGDDDDDEAEIEDPAADAAEETAVRKTCRKLPYEEYMRLANSLVVFIISETEKNAENISFQGVRKSSIVAQYLEEKQDQINDEAELLEQTEFINKVIDRLMYQDQILIPLRTEESRPREDGVEADDPIVTVHNDYVLSV